MPNETDLTEILPPVTEPAPEAADYSSSLWDRLFPRDTPFFKVALLDRLLHRPFHAVTLEGPINVQRLARDYREQTFRSETSIDRSGKQKISGLLLHLADEVFACLEEGSFKVYAPTPESARAAARKFRRYVQPPVVDKPCFHVISIEPTCGPSTETVIIERAASATSGELALNYGADFPSWEAEWTNRLSRTPSGLTIFHGSPGCGKTSYLRALMARLVDKAVFYFIPVSEAGMLSDSRFTGFWIQQAKRHQGRTKIVLLEDAEELLLPRETGSREKVSNLLNLADGFLGDHLKLHIIATTNSQVRELDRALLRPGRLIGTREFRRLTRAEAQRLAEAKGLVLADQDDFSLAEVYCGAASHPAFNADRRVGFV